MPNLINTYQIVFPTTGNWGYGVTLDLIKLFAYESVGVKELSAGTTISVYSNYASDYIFVNREGNDEIFIYDTFRSLIKSSRENRISISDLASGIYVVKTSEGTV